MKLGWSVSWLVAQGWKWFGDFCPCFVFFGIRRCVNTLRLRGCKALRPLRRALIVCLQPDCEEADLCVFTGKPQSLICKMGLLMPSCRFAVSVRGLGPRFGCKPSHPPFPLPGLSRKGSYFQRARSGGEGDLFLQKPNKPLISPSPWGPLVSSHRVQSRLPGAAREPVRAAGSTMLISPPGPDEPHPVRSSWRLGAQEEVGGNEQGKFTEGWGPFSLIITNPKMKEEGLPLPSLIPAC